MDYQAERLGLIVDLAEQSMDIVQRFSNDPIEAASIQTATGPIKNLKQVSADIKSDGEAAIDVAVTELIETLKTDTSVGALIDGLTDSAALAEASAERSESSASLAAAFNNPFPSTADGLNNTSGSGALNRFFSVPGAGNILATAYRNDAGSAVKIGEAPSAKSVNDLAEDYRATLTKGDAKRSLYWGGFMSKSGMVGVAFRKSDGHPIFADGRDVLADVAGLRNSMGTNTTAITELADDYQATIAKGDANRSLYWGGFVSKSGMVGVAFRKSDGHPIFADGRDVLSEVAGLRETVQVVSAPRAGVLMGFKTPAGRLLGHFDAHTGEWMTGGRSALAEVDKTNARVKVVEAALGNPLADFPVKDWACWGDSLTAAGSSGNWPSKLATALGVDIYNGGWGGQAFRQIAARNGASPCLMTVVGGSIPASGAVAVTTNLYYPASNGGSVSGTLSGVPGSYTRAADGLSATFTRTTAGSAVASPANAVFAPLYGSTMRDRHVVLWCGANSVYYEADQYDIIASIRPMIDYLTPRVKRVIVMEIPPSAARTLPAAPGSEREKLDKFNVMLKAAFPEYFLDIASWLRTQAAATAAGIVFTAQDLTDISNGVTPTSFTSDGLHFNDAGGTAIAYRVQQEAITRGWIA